MHVKKKIILVLLIPLLITGCSIRKVNVNNYDSLIDSYFNGERKVKRSNFQGYSLYIPKGLKLDYKDDNNIVFRDKNNNVYYVYVDTVSHINKTHLSYKKYKNNYYYKNIKGKNHNGYIEIIKDNEKYFLHGAYNYVKIEVYSRRNAIPDTIINMCEVMSSVKYNDNILKLDSSNTASGKEEEFNIFTSKKKNSGSYLEYVRENENVISSVEKSSSDEDMIDIDSFID